MSIASEIYETLKIPTRLKNVIPAYLTSLMTESHTHTLTHAAKLCGLAISQFSRLLAAHKELALEHLNRPLQLWGKAAIRRYSGLSRATFDRRIQGGTLKRIKLGRRVLFQAWQVKMV